MRNPYCTRCGTAFTAEAYLRTCPGCGETTWDNPLPVAVTLVPVRAAGATGPGGTGIVVVRRGIEPGYGELALPGGFMEVGESWREAAARELREETTIAADPATVRLFDLFSSPTGHRLIVVAVVPPRDSADLPPMVPNDETLEWLVLPGPRDLVFDTHTAALAAYFASA
jgi:ADP-ribose pyrophosphatase YjhB (NUDIX family)